MAEASLAFIGGSGLYQVEGFTDTREVDVNTPFGAPSDKITIGSLEGTSVAFLPRHGRGHRLSPTEIPARANIYALKSIGVERIVSISAVGSLQEEVRPLDMVVPDQLIDRTRSRVNTFFEDGIVAHVGFADPFCPVLSAVLARAATPLVKTHVGGTCVVMEGPQFSTRAESQLYRSWGASVIGMTALPEAKLAREAEICYAILALVTDYDCWRDSEGHVSVDLVVQNLRKNAVAAQEVLRSALGMVPSQRDCSCPDALKNAIITSPDLITSRVRSRLAALMGKYLEATNMPA